MQGDACSLGIHIYNNAGNPVTPLDIRDLEITVGSLRKTYQNAQLIYRDCLWLFPLSQQETFQNWPAFQKAQVRIRWANGVVEGKALPPIPLHESISKEVL